MMTDCLVMAVFAPIEIDNPQEQGILRLTSKPMTMMHYSACMAVRMSRVL